MKNIVSYGGGTQSSAMIIMALEGVYNWPRPDFGVYADTGGEPEFINDYVRYFIAYVKKKYDFDIFMTQYKQGIVHRLLHDEIRKTNSGLMYISSNPPYHTLYQDGTKGIMMRQCTREFKIHPLAKLINSKLKRGEKYTQWIGISFDERSRMKISTNKRITNFYPLVNEKIRRADSIEFLKKMGVRPPQRSSCFFCPFHSDRYWLWLKKYHPSEFQRAVDFERAVQNRQNDYRKTEIFLHRSCKPLDEVIFADENQLNMFPELIDECDGECGI